MVNFIPQSIPNISGNEGAYLKECVDSTFVSSVGPFVSRFELELSEITGSKYCVAVSSGTAALHLALLSSGVKEEEIVILPTYTFIASANAISHCGASPWLFDIDKDNLNLDLNLVEKSLLEECYEDKGSLFHKLSGKRIAAVMPVFSLGNPMDSEKLSNFETKWKIPIIIDSAAALGCKTNNLNLGEISAIAKVISFNGNKTFTCGGGGAILTNDSSVFKKLKHISSTARKGDEYFHDEVGFNYRMTNLQAAVGVAQLERYEEFIEKKRFIFNFYKKNIQHKDIQFQEISPSLVSSHWLSFFKLKKESVLKPEDFYDAFCSNHIESKAFWIPLDKQPPYKLCYSTLTGVSEEIYKRIIILPSSTNIKERELLKVTDTVNSLIN